jgi:hypothetical protein
MCGVFVPEAGTIRRTLMLLGIAVTLGACSSDSGLPSLQLNPFSGDRSRSDDYNYFYRRDVVVTGHVVASDLVGPDGRCAFDPAPAAPFPGAPAAEQPPPEAAPIDPRSNRALYFTAGPPAGTPTSFPPGAAPPPPGGPRGIALAMTECEVVRVAGYTDRVEISADPRGQRMVTLTYLSGERPGIYRFVGGRLASMERVEAPPAPKKPARPSKTAKTKPRK